MVDIPYAELHAFPDEDRPHSGNPAGVALLTQPLPDADLQGIAHSNNLSETAYLVADGAEADVWSLRWFTPETEVALCGHATLASAVHLFETGRVTGHVARFDTRSGRLTVTREGAVRYVMDFPEVAFQPGTATHGVAEALGGPAPEAVFEINPIHGARYQMLVFTDEATVAGLQPDFGVLAKAGVNIIATAKGTSADFVCRFFAPTSGIPEDPVTGSAYCTLGPYWTKVLGQPEMTARQIGPRPGALSVRIDTAGRVSLIGTAARYLQGVIRF